MALSNVTLCSIFILFAFTISSQRCSFFFSEKPLARNRESNSHMIKRVKGHAKAGCYFSHAQKLNPW